MQAVSHVVTEFRAMVPFMSCFTFLSEVSSFVLETKQRAQRTHDTVALVCNLCSTNVGPERRSMKGRLHHLTTEPTGAY